MSVIRFTSLGGGAGEVGRSSGFLEVLETEEKYVIDSGIMLDNIIRKPGYRVIRGKAIDALFLTHYHLDHIGSGPIFNALHPEAKIYMSRPTRPLARLLLEDTLAIAKSEGKRPIFSKKEMKNFLEKIILVPSPGWFYIPGTKSRVNLWPAGTHGPGAASILLDTPQAEIICSGDLLFDETPLMKGGYRLPYFPKKKKRVVIIEATYGDDEYPPRVSEEARLVEIVKERVSRGGNALICAFALGGCQNFALKLNAAGVECYLDGMARKAAEYFSKSRWCDLDKTFDLLGTKIKPVPYARANDFREWFAKQTGVCLVSPSGAAEGGPSRFFLERWASDPKNTIIFPQFIPGGTLGERIIRAFPGELISYYDTFWERDVTFTLRARVVKLNIHHHSRGSESAKWVYLLDPDAIIMNHGTDSGCRGLERKIINEYKNRFKIPPQIFWGRNFETIEI